MIRSICQNVVFQIVYFLLIATEKSLITRIVDFEHLNWNQKDLEDSLLNSFMEVSRFFYQERLAEQVVLLTGVCGRNL